MTRAACVSRAPTADRPLTAHPSSAERQMRPFPVNGNDIPGVPLFCETNGKCKNARGDQPFSIITSIFPVFPVYYRVGVRVRATLYLVGPIWYIGTPTLANTGNTGNDTFTKQPSGELPFPVGTGTRGHPFPLTSRMGGLGVNRPSIEHINGTNSHTQVKGVADGD